MLELLDKAVAVIPELLERPTEWGTLVINRRKPFTYRAFISWNGFRICLHRFETCDEEEALLHPHPWPGAFRIIRGSYLMGVGFSEDRFSKPRQVMRTVMTPASRYEIINPLTWHSVVPQEECYTIMINGDPWSTDVAHTEVRTTKGKGLIPMAEDDIVKMFGVFKEALLPSVMTDNA